MHRLMNRVGAAYAILAAVTATVALVGVMPTPAAPHVRAAR